MSVLFVKPMSHYTVTDRYIGVDVQTRRGCPFAVLDHEGNSVDTGWLNGESSQEIVQSLADVAMRHAVADRDRVFLGIDAPRAPLRQARIWYWRENVWRECRPEDRGAGRHCEVVIKAHRLANPQWTPAQNPPAWMQLGFALFEELGKQFTVYEVFPSASYALLAGDAAIEIKIQLGNFRPGPKDMLDAYIAAVTVREFVQERGMEVGGGDDMGSIILPRRIPNAIQAVLEWPRG